MPGFNEVGEILSIIDLSSCDEFILETKDIKLVVRRGGTRTGAVESVAPTTPVARAEPPRSPSSTTDQSAPAAELPASTSAEAGTDVIRAPTVGTFYRASSPDQPPFVEVGNKIRKGDPVCMIEVMKLFTTIHAEADGVITSIDAENGHLVEFGQILFRMDTA